MQTHTQMRIATFEAQVRAGSWRWQKRGVTRLVAWPAIEQDMPHMNCKRVIIRRYRYGAIGVTPSSKYYMHPYTREDAEQFAEAMGVKLMPGIGGDTGPWLTTTPVL